MQLGSRPTIGTPCTNRLTQCVEDLAQQPLGRVEHAVVVQRPAAAQALWRYPDLVAGMFEHVDCRLRDRGSEVVVERVGPQDHRAACRRCAAPRSANHCLNVSGANGGMWRCCE